MTGARWILDFPDEHPHGPIVYVDGPMVALHLDQPSKVDRARLEFERMWNELAVTTTETRHILDQAATRPRARTP